VPTWPTSEVAVLRAESSPGYQALFGELDSRADDDARSVYSPAAYFVDLLALLEGNFDGPSLLARRPDLKQLPLDATNTFTETPYLDIVIEVLERLVGADPYAKLRDRTHPLSLPFSLDTRQLGRYLHHLQVTPLELYRLFAAEPDHDLAAREYLELSPDAVDALTTPAVDEAALRVVYGLAETDSLDELRDTERFAEATGLTGAELRELVAVRPPVTVSVDGTSLDWGESAPLPWLDEANRLIRLARLTGLSLTDLDLAVTSCCTGGIDEPGLRTMAVVLRLHRVHDLSITDICRMVVPVEPPEVRGCSGDILAARNDDYRFRLAGWIEVAESDIAGIVRRYREHYRAEQPGPFDRGDIGLAEIGLLHRAGRIAGALGITTDELFDVLVALETDPSLHRYSTFAVLGDTTPRRRDCFDILAGGDPAESLWLAQHLFAIVTWTQAAGFTGQELTEVLGGRPDTDDGSATALVDGIGQAFEQVGFGPSLFAGGRFGERAAAVIHDVLTAYDDGVVCAANDRLLRLEPAAAETAAYDGVTDLGVLVVEDFLGLGLGERLQAKIFGNLVHLGHLYADGTLAVTTTEGLELASDFNPFRETLFKTIGTAVNGSAALFPSDMAAFDDLTPPQQAELYDNLIYNGYLDEAGDLTDPTFFVDEANLQYFQVNADLGDSAEAVLALLDDRITAFDEDPLPIDPDILTELRLTDTALTELVESLMFNGYLDENGDYSDKVAIAALPVEEFGLALAFHQRRQAVLEAIQGQILAFQTELHTFAVEDFAGIADAAVCHRVITALAETGHTAGGRVTDEALFADPSGSLDLGSPFTYAEQETIFRRVGAVLEDEKPYRLAPAALTDLGFTDSERDSLLAHLVESGYLIEGFAVAQEWLAYFRTINNGYDFALPGLADYSQDVFLLLHAVAVELAAAMAEIVDALTGRAEQQRQALYGALADTFGIPAATGAAICDAVTGGPDHALDVLAAPALGDEDATADPHFRLAHRRIRRFALLAAKLGLDPAEVTAVFTDQDLVGKFPESLTLPPGVSRFDALLEGGDGTIYLFTPASYWTYAAGTYVLTSPTAIPLTQLSPRFADLTGIDAAFTLPSGLEWIIGHTADGTSRSFNREPGGTRWAPREQVWGKVRNNFDDPPRIDGAFVDTDGRTYLFSGDQYVRYSTRDHTFVDEGYPRPVTEWQEREGLDETLAGPLDAFQAPDGRVFVLTGATGWGRVRNAFDGIERLDAAQATASAVHLYAGGQVVRYSDSIENGGVLADEGHPRAIHGVPARFEGGVDAAFTDPAGVLHLFKAGDTASVGGQDASTVPTAHRWGVLSPALPGRTVDAAFAGLDGRTYLFGGGTYLRYSTADYSAVDPGYPRTVNADWGGLSRVDAAFVMDGATFLFGVGGTLFELPVELHDDLTAAHLTPALRNRFAEHGLTVTAISGSAPTWTVATEEKITLTVTTEGLRRKVHANGSRFYVRYATNDYRTPDPGFPKPLADNWWNMPDGLELGPIDAVFTGSDNHTYLFSGNRFVRFDARHRWWSQPMSLEQRWDSVPFRWVDAAFVGQDGRTYLFSGDRYVRYSTGDYTEVDDGYPANIAGHWDNVRNNIERTGVVDAALVRPVVEKVDGVDVARTYTYLFSGDQYVRYLGTGYDRVQSGYPRLVEDLATEPGMAALDTVLGVTLDHVDAAFADRRTTYLFSGTECHAVSAGTYRRYDDLDLGEVCCAFVEDGSIMLDGGYYSGGWARVSALEGGKVTTTRFRPRTLRTVPEEFRTGLNSVLLGADGNTYLFRGTQCFNTQLNRAYPLAQEWGRPRNPIYSDSRVDAAFVGRDGRTYVFSDDQFVVHTATATTTDGDPRPIADHWAGLTSVALAYVQGETTFLFERPDADGQIRYVAYSGTGYGSPDEGYPAIVDESVMGAPDGFPFPDAVLFEGGTMILLSGTDCVSFSATTQRWSAVRPIERLFPGFGRDLDAPDRLRTAFTAADGATYFFFDETFTRFADHACGPLTPIRDRWGLSANPFVTEGGTIDAAFVWRGEQTYLFSGDRYVRYTGPDYHPVDPGYPKKIAGNLRREEPFANLPESFEDALDRPLDAVVGNDRTIHVIIGGTCHTVSTDQAGSYPLDRIGLVRNTFAGPAGVDAAFVADRRVYLLRGDQYVRYSSADYSFVDDGYPRPLAELADDEVHLAELPAEFADGVDAAFHDPGGHTHLFKGKQFVRGGAPEPVNASWGKVHNELAAGGPEAAFVSPQGDLYAFRGGQYARYRAGVVLETVDPGFPRTVADDWGDLPSEFEDGPDGAFLFEGRAYLTLEDLFVRYSGEYDRVDRTFPQEFAHRWAGTSDYRLGDLHTIVRFVELARSCPDGLAAFFTDGADDPYEYLAGLFGWDVAELRWARRNSDLLTPGTPEEKVFEIEFLLRLVDLFATARKFGTGPSRIHAEVWSKLYGQTPEPRAAIAAVAGLLEHRTAPREWVGLEARIHDELNVEKRDALVAAITRSRRELFERYLIDVDMGPQGTTSRVREAIAATQLFLHRYLIDLETVALPEGADPDEVRARLKTWWGWMRNYRVWEANRKVFLYPENYLRPELRTHKTPAFTALEDDLLRGEITAESVQAAYKRYLDEYTEVSRLAIAGGYVYTEDDAPANARKLVLFGRTRTEPRRYYYRGAEFRDGEKLSSSWDPWLKVDVQIDAERVDPVHAFGRVFVFWPVVEVVTADDPSQTTIVTTAQADGQKIEAPDPRYRVKICYSFYNLNREWVPAQVLAVDKERTGPITGLRLHVQASREVLGVSSHDSIVVQCTYSVGTELLTSAFTLTPELYGMPATGAILPPRAADPARVLDEPATTRIDPAAIVPFNAPADTVDTPWSAIDHKGGSFLCRPVAAPTEAPPSSSLGKNQDNLPTTWDRIDAGVQLDDGTRYFFGKAKDMAAEIFVAVPPDKVTFQQTKRPTAERFGLVGTNLSDTGVVDAVLVRENHVFLFSGDEYYRYPTTDFGALDAGYPKKLAANAEGLPEWPKIDAVFSGPPGTEIFYNRTDDRYAVSGALQSLKRAGDLWPLIGAGAKLGAVIQRDSRLHLVFGNQYLRLNAELRPEWTRLHDLAKNPDDIPESGVVNGPSFRLGQSVVRFDNTNGSYTVDAPGGDTPSRSTRELGRVHTALSRGGRVDAAYRTDDALFLVSGNEFVRYTLGGNAGTIPAYVDAGYPKKVAWPIDGVGAVDAVFRRDEVWHVFSGGRYGTIEAGQELDTTLTLLPIEGNWRCLPAAFPKGFSGLAETGEALYFFAGSDYTAYPVTDAVARPYEISALPNEIIRLTSSTAYELNRRLLVGGIGALLAPDTQELDELPAFSTTVSDATTVRVRERTAKAGVPVGSHLDFDSSNGLYYWEIFFFAPMLIAGALNDAQRFDDARRWYEYVFDPTRRERYWRFLPFLAVDVEALAVGCRADLARLPGTPFDSRLREILDTIEAMAPAFLQQRALTGREGDYLETLAGKGLDEIRAGLAAPPVSEAKRSLAERVAMIGLLGRQYRLMGDRESLLDAYRNDPFDPHAIARLRPSAYRRTAVMAYIDNLVDWGDMLFRQYTAESIDEARMLYVFAGDLLGEQPYDLGQRALPAAASYDSLDGDTEGDTDGSAAVARLTLSGALLEGSGAIHAGVANPYFYVPDNDAFLEYWTRVGDRLGKIRASLDIMGVSRPVPLFEPPADVMALVRGVARGAPVDAITAGLAVPVPTYRFPFLHRRATELADRLKQLAGDLLGAFERRDAEELSLLHQRQEAAILELTHALRASQVEIAGAGLRELRAALAGAQDRARHYQTLISTGLSPLQQAQLAMMSIGAAGHFAAGGLKIGAAIASAAPEVYLGPFIMGSSYGGQELGDSLGSAADVSAAFAEAFSMLGEALGVRADQERQAEDWNLQLAIARSDVTQLGHQVEGGELAVAVAQRELAIHERESRNHEEVTAFLTGKFAGAQLYGWMAQQLSGLYFQTYNMAYELARSAEKAYQFERCTTNGANIQPSYWDSRRSGLLAAESLTVDLDRLGHAYFNGGGRGLEITKRVSLLALDPLALLALKDEGRCEFALTEELFDRDFPGHYRRQIRTLSVTFDTPDGPVGINASLTQLDNRTVLSADPKAVRYLLDPKGSPPGSLRADWRPSQQIALSDIEEGRDNNGLFELRYDDDRYLPFEGTGAVSRWRLDARRVPAGLIDVTVTVKYTAENGGETFATAVRGMLRPYPSARYLDLAAEFPDEWAAFLESDARDLYLPITPEYLPGMAGRQITGVCARYERSRDGEVRFLLNGDRGLALDDGRLLRTPGLALGGWTLLCEGDKSSLANLGLILTYRAGAQ
jgi:hypothetical protein